MVGKNFFRTLTLAGAAAVLASGSAWAQTTTEGAISGTVFDATNAAVAGAKIVIHNTQTGADKTLTADSGGFFKAPELDPGTYKVTITAAGFATLNSNEVVVEVNKVTEFNEHLTAGGESTVVEVTTAPPVLDFESATFGGHLENTEIENLPLNNRRWSTLALLTPGATVDVNGFGLLQFHAISPLLNNVEIDGADDNEAFFSEERGRTRAGYSTAQSMIQEFQVNTGVYNAEFGRAVGGVINSVTKQGTNALHGEAYFFNRKSSRSAFQPGASITTQNAAGVYVQNPYKPKDNRNQFGFELGGALIKDKLFYAYAFDMFRRNFPGTAKANVPATFFAAPTAATLTTLASRLGTTSANAATLYNNQLSALLGDLGPVPRIGDQEINTPRLDYQLGQKHHISLLYHRLRWDSPGGVQTQGTNQYAIDTFGNDFVKLDYGLAKLESVFTPHLTNELRYQYGKELLSETNQTPSSYTCTYLGGAAGCPNGGNLTAPEVAIATGTSGFYAGQPYYGFRAAYPLETKWQVGDSASFLFGKHNIRFGGDFVHNYDLQNNLYESNGYYSYSTLLNYMSDVLSNEAGANAAALGRNTCDSGGTGVGSAATGYFPCYSSYSQSFGQPVLNIATQDYGAFVQDDYKLTPHLTVNLGVRYDLELLPQPFAPNPALPQTTIRPVDGNNVSPRVGFAWDPYGDGKTAVHGGFGIYYGRVYNAALLNALENTGAGITASSATSTSQAAYTFSSTSVGAPTLPTTATVIPPFARSGTLPSLEYLDPNLQNPYTEQFDFAIQQQLALGTVLSVSYFGALGRELPNYLNFNLNPVNRYTINYTVQAATGTTTCGPIACGTVIPTLVYSSKTQTGTAASQYVYNVPNQNASAITDVVSNVNSTYHAVTVEVQRRSGKFFQFDANYTWSHALDYNQTVGTSFTAGANNWFDPFGNARANYANSTLNFPHRVVAWGLINLPGVRDGSKLSYLANGWSIKPLVQAQTGLQYSANTTGTTPNECGLATCLETAGSGLAGTGVTYIPQIGRNTLHQPNTALADLRIEKDFSITERAHLQLMGDAFNLWNHENVQAVSTTAYTIGTNTTNPAAYTSTLTYNPTSFGVPSAVNSTYAFGPRQIQVSARVVF